MSDITKKSLGFLLVFLLIVSCLSKKELLIKEKYAVLSLIIDESTIPLLVPPPPPPIGVKDSLAKERDSILKLMNSDEWKNQTQIIAIDTIAFRPGSKIVLEDSISKEYKALFDQLLSDKTTESIDISKIEATRGNRFIVSPSVNEIRKNKDLWNIFDVLVSFSNIAFDESYSRAVVFFGETYGKLDAYASYIFLEKIDGKWKIKYEKVFQIS